MSNALLTQRCPACKEEAHYLIDWEYSGLGNSVFNYTAKLYECHQCGLVYVENITDEQLSLFYQGECSYFEKNHFAIDSPENRLKYQSYHRCLVDAKLADLSVVDVGCGRGGFLLWLSQNNWKAHCVGIDVDLKSIPALNEETQASGVSFMEGRAVALPFADGTQSLLTYLHVLEHIRNIDQLLWETYRVLNAGGHLLIEVPDAERYENHPIGTAFWLSIREHIYHFTACSLINALRRNGFETVSVSRQSLPTPEFIYPSLMILAKKCAEPVQEQCAEKSAGLAAFVVHSRNALEAQAEKVQEIYSDYPALTFWGCSSELFSLMPLLKLESFTLCDSSKIKQRNHYKGITINDPGAITRTGALIVAPYLHGDAIEACAIELGWAKEDIFRLK